MRGEVLASSLGDCIVSLLCSISIFPSISSLQTETKHTLLRVGGRDVLGGVSDLSCQYDVAVDAAIQLLLTISKDNITTCKEGEKPIARLFNLIHLQPARKGEKVGAILHTQERNQFHSDIITIRSFSAFTATTHTSVAL
jgi:hypothetical protein